MKKILVLILLIFSEMAYSQWEPCNTGLYGAWIKSMIIHNGTIYIGVYGGGVSISTNMGVSWSQKNDGLSNLDVLCMDIKDSNLIVGTKGGVFLSTNNGDNWIKKNVGLSNLKITSISINDENVYAGTDGDGIFISNNFTESWYDESIDSLDMKKYISSIIAKDSLVFAGTINKGVFLSTDYGKSWSNKSAGLLNNEITKLLFKGDSIYAGTNGSLSISTNNGNKWSSINISKMFGAKVESFAISGDTIAVATSTSKIFVSKNNGNSWENYNIEQCPTSLIINNSEFILGTIGGVKISTDTGISWKNINYGLENVVVNAIEYNGDNIFVGSYGNGVFISTNNGVNWKDVNKGLFSDHYFTSQVTSISAIDNKIIAGTYEDIFLSSDYGETWINKTNGYNIGSLVLAVKNDKIFSGYFGYGIHLSSDYGNSWVDKNNGLSDNYIYSLAIKDNYIFAGTHYNGIFVSTDDGDNWILKKKKSFIYCLVVSGNNIYAGSSIGEIYLSTSNGDGWKKIKEITFNEIVWSLAAVNNNIFAGTTNGLYLSTDNGLTWELKNDGLKSLDIRALKIKGDTIYAGTYGGGMHRARLADFGITSVNDNKITKDNYLYAFPPFPNPATKEVRSLVYWDTSTDITQDEINVYNMYGAKVSDKSKITFDKQNAYSGYLIWYCAGIETGVYMIVIKHGTETRTIKVVVN